MHWSKNLKASCYGLELVPLMLLQDPLQPALLIITPGLSLAAFLVNTSSALVRSLMMISEKFRHFQHCFPFCMSTMCLVY